MITFVVIYFAEWEDVQRVLTGAHGEHISTMISIVQVIVLMSHSGRDIEKLDDLAGLNANHSWLAFLMLLLMFSMAGVPPIIGFIAKMRILEALMQAHQIFYAVLAVLFAIIGAYYYLRVVMIMYFKEPVGEIKTYYTRPQAAAIGLNSLAVLALGIYPVPLFQICRWVFLVH